MKNDIDLGVFIFGGGGDLALRKLYPALYQNYLRGDMPKSLKIFALSFSCKTSEDFRTDVLKALEEQSSNEYEPKKAHAFVSLIFYWQHDVTNDGYWKSLATKIDEEKINEFIFYLSVSPKLFEPILKGLVLSNLNSSTSRVVIEKPFGVDLESAKKLNNELAAAFNEDQIYRIDHYLGKDSIQNLFALRFSNAFIESQWHAGAIESVEITVAERLGVEKRGDYYDSFGATKDMLQNHLLQMLSIFAMECPYSFNSNAIRDEKVKVLKSLKIIDSLTVKKNCVRGQYAASSSENSYLQDIGESSDTETYIALKMFINNRRWSGVPFYVRTGKKLAKQIGRIVVNFKTHQPQLICSSDGGVTRNQLVINFQPDENILFQINHKDFSRTDFCTSKEALEFASDKHDKYQPYARLLRDILYNDQTLFVRNDEIEASWYWIDSLIAAWQSSNADIQLYNPYSAGPKLANQILEPKHTWSDL